MVAGLTPLSLRSDRGADPWWISLVKGKQVTQGIQHRISGRSSDAARVKRTRPATNKLPLRLRSTARSWEGSWLVGMKYGKEAISAHGSTARVACLWGSWPRLDLSPGVRATA